MRRSIGENNTACMKETHYGRNYLPPLRVDLTRNWSIVPSVVLVMTL